MFDKAGRDATVDFGLAHGTNNLRIESAMLPYRIGKLLKPWFETTNEHQAYMQRQQFLHAACEIRNVFYLDVNMFSGGNESSGSPHSLAMRAKTHKKFITLSLPMLEAASSTCCDVAESFPTMLREFTEELASCLSSYNDLPLFVATELCQIEKDYLSSFVEIVADLVARVEVTSTVGTTNDFVIDVALPGLQNLCSSTLDGIERLLEAFCIVLATKSDSGIIQKALNYHEPCSALAKHEFEGKDVVVMQFHQGQLIFRSGDIIDLIYVVMEGAVVACDQGIEIDRFLVETAFGAITRGSQIDPTRNKLGHEVMSFTAKVISECCKVAVLHPLQLLQTHARHQRNKSAASRRIHQSCERS